MTSGIRPGLRSTATALGLILSPLIASAQSGPSFDCDYAATPTEIGICASPDLALLERRMAEAYEGLAARIGRPEARAIADEQLALRETCGWNGPCVAARLVTAAELFAAIARPTEAPTRPLGAPVFRTLDEVLAGAGLTPAPTTPVPPTPVPLAPATPAAAPPPADPATPGALPPGRIERVAAPAPEPAAAPAAPVAAEPPAPVPDAASAEYPVSVIGRAFADLPDYRRRNVQGRLGAAGYYGGAVDGRATLALESALWAFVADAATRGRPFDAADPDGAAAALDAVESDWFREAYLSPQGPPP